ncbi:hypothetical protein TNCV_622951 [Trichonephila clavipes]|nr:hypothetical protein TNCV_622951 [Trichonephila clavipes]
MIDLPARDRKLACTLTSGVATNGQGGAAQRRPQAQVIRDILSTIKELFAFRGHRENLSQDGLYGTFLSIVSLPFDMITYCGKF